MPEKRKLFEMLEDLCIISSQKRARQSAVPPSPQSTCICEAEESDEACDADSEEKEEIPARAYSCGDSYFWLFFGLKTSIIKSFWRQNI